MRVSDMRSPRTGSKVANQFIITDGGTKWFQSYDTLVAKDAGGTITLDTRALDYSVTTSKYLYAWLGLTDSAARRTVQRRIAAGIYAVADLNAREER